MRIPDRRVAVLRAPDFIRLAGVRALDIRGLPVEAVFLVLVAVDRLFDIERDLATGRRVLTDLRAAFRILELRVVLRAAVLRVVRGFRALVDFRMVVLRTLVVPLFREEILFGEVDF